MQTTTYQPNTTDHQNILQTLGLQEKHLREIGTRALASYTSTTDDDAIGAAGQYAYLAAVRATREFLRPVGWTRYKKKGQNIEFAALPSKNILLCTSSGDKNTGLEAEPKTKNPKGAQTQRIVNNNAQLAFPFLIEMEKEVEISDTAPVWIFLYHISPQDGVLRMELSLPVGFNPVNFCVDGWQHRIVLNPIEFSPVPTIPEPDFADSPDIEIKRKTQ